MIEDPRIADRKERAYITTHVRENMCVEAGAGTGKTTVLVQRIINTVASGQCDVRHMAVITFTEKAAAELAGRVRRGLEDALAAAADAEQASRIETALRGLNHAHIETIHAFAASLLRERPIEAGLDPGFEVMDVLPSQLAFESAYREWLNGEMASDPPPPALLEALDLGLTIERVREAAEALHRYRFLLPLDPYDRVDADAGGAFASIAADAAVLASMRGAARDEDDQAYRAALAVAEWFEEVSVLRGDAATLRRAIAGFKMPSYSRGNQKNWRDPDDCRAAKESLRQIKNALDAARAAMRANAVAALLGWLQGFVRQYDASRRDASKADFDDLLIWSRDLIRGNAEVRRYFQAKYRSVLVDEFQDTDPLQAELIIRLCAEDPAPDDWTRAALRPGSLFVVGDPKQSIYRFRRADIAMYDDVKQHVFGGEPRHITQNFRSVGPIIEWVNAIFKGLFTPEPRVHPPYVALDAHPDYVADEGVTVLRGVAPSSTEDKAPSADDLRRFEAAKLAALIRDGITSGTWRARADGGWRPAAYRDIAVLIPVRAGLEIYEDAFALAKIPYRHEGGRTFFDRQEVRELIAVLRAIDDPGDGVAAVAALRSAAFGRSDEDLLLHRAAGGRFDHASVRDGDAGAVASALRTLAALAALRHTHPLPEVVRAALDRTRLVEFAMLQHQGEQVAANLLKVIDQARAFSEASGHGLRGFVRWLRDNALRVSDEADAPISEETDDVVRLMTVHAAKGLEFPIVVFANMSALRADRTTVIPDRTRRRLHVKLGKNEDGFRTPGYGEIEAEEQAHRLAEERRLLYVAATRARDRLVLSFPLQKDAPVSREGPKSLSDWLRTQGADAALNVDIDALAPPAGELPIWRREPGAADADETERIAAERDTWKAGRAALLDRANAGLRVLTASALKPEWDHPVTGDGVRRGSATEFGSAVHAVLERAGLADGPHIDELAHAVAREYGQRGREDEIAAVTRTALGSTAITRARASRRVLPEVPFAVPLDGGGLAEGRIDLLFEEDGALVVVDYKTDAVSAAEIEKRAGEYRKQALIYAWAAARAAAMPVREVIFLFARPGIERAMPVDAAFQAEAEALLRPEPAAQGA